MKVLLKNRLHINTYIEAKLAHNDGLYGRIGDIIDFVENHPEYMDDSFRIEDVNEKLPWTIYREIKNGEPEKEYIQYLVMPEYSLYDETINYYMPTYRCDFRKNWEIQDNNYKNRVCPPEWITKYCDGKIF